MVCLSSFFSDEEKWVKKPGASLVGPHSGWKIPSLRRRQLGKEREREKVFSASMLNPEDKRALCTLSGSTLSKKRE